MSSKNNKTNMEEALLSCFEEIKAFGETTLLPRSVVSDTISDNGDRSGSNKPVSYLHRFDFGEFFLSVVYTPSRSFLTSAPSTLEVRICLDRSEPLLFLSPYDIIPYLNPSDLICRYFPYIESPERMRSCYQDLVESLLPYLDDFDRIAENKEELFRTYNYLRDEMVRCYGDNIFLSSGKGEDYDASLTALRFYHFVKWRSSFFSSQEYAAFLSGDLAPIATLANRKFLPDYFRHLLVSLPNLQEKPVKAVRERSASLPTMVKATTRATTFPILILSFLLTLPLMAGLFALLYFGVAAIVGSGAIFYSALTLNSFLNNISFIAVATLSVTLSASHIVLRLFFRKRYEAFSPYREMLKKNPVKNTPSRLKKIILFLAVIFITLSACRGVMFTDQKIIAQSNFLPMDNEQYLYTEIEYVSLKTDRDGIHYFDLHLKNGDKVTLVVTDLEKVNETILSIFETKGIEVYPDGQAPEPPETVPDTGKDETVVEANPSSVKEIHQL